MILLMQGIIGAVTLVLVVLALGDLLAVANGFGATFFTEDRFGKLWRGRIFWIRRP